MDSNVRKAWLEAGKILGTDPSAAVPCPVCGKATLIVQDVPIPNSNKFERILRCPDCNAGNAMLMIRKN